MLKQQLKQQSEEIQRLKEGKFNYWASILLIYFQTEDF